MLTCTTALSCFSLLFLCFGFYFFESCLSRPRLLVHLSWQVYLGCLLQVWFGKSCPFASWAGARRWLRWRTELCKVDAVPSFTDGLRHNGAFLWCKQPLAALRADAIGELGVAGAVGVADLGLNGWLDGWRDFGTFCVLFATGGAHNGSVFVVTANILHGIFFDQKF